MQCTDVNMIGELKCYEKKVLNPVCYFLLISRLIAAEYAQYFSLHSTYTCTVEPLYFGHPWDRKVSLIERCPHFKGQMYNILMFGTAQAVLIRGVSLFQECPYFRGVLI